VAKLVWENFWPYTMPFQMYFIIPHLFSHFHQLLG
jgi:hypothetical protein